MFCDAVGSNLQRQAGRVDPVIEPETQDACGSGEEGAYLCWCYRDSVMKRS